MKWIAILITTLGFCALASGKTNLKNGEKIYTAHCAVCHMNGVAQAPKVHDQAIWNQRLEAAMAAVKKIKATVNQQQATILAFKQLVDTVKRGKGAMPAGGMCPKCSDQDYLDAIHFMMSKKRSG